MRSYHSAHVLRGQHVGDSVLLPPWGSQRGTQLIRLGSRCLCPLSHLTEWLCAFKNYMFPLTHMKELSSPNPSYHVEGVGRWGRLQTMGHSVHSHLFLAFPPVLQDLGSTELFYSQIFLKLQLQLLKLSKFHWLTCPCELRAVAAMGSQAEALCSK